ncbi:MAG UNVERIFIED_CONTAM: hypothetical protein LVR29_24730 [Microcystis novacekii LVE1205-3]
MAVNQGKNAGAVTIGVDIWHLDVPEFLGNADRKW